jgi:protein gp37
MSERTSISWTEHTWNPWEGCTRISPGCANCYMFTQLRRRGRDPGTLRRTGTWHDPDRWNAAAAESGVPALVFTCSLSDWFHKDADPWRPEAWQLIRRCQHLRFQILTKRPFRIAERLPPDWGDGYENIWLGVSIEDNEQVWRVDVLRKIPARVRFISAEPLLGPLRDLDLRGFHWLIVGGESGPGYRHMDRNWARQLRDQAKAAGVAFFFKQSAAFRPGQGDLLDGRQWHEFPPMSGPANQAAGQQHEEADHQKEEEERARLAQETLRAQQEAQRRQDEERARLERASATLRRAAEQRKKENLERQKQKAAAAEARRSAKEAERRRQAEAFERRARQFEEAARKLKECTQQFAIKFRLPLLPAFLEDELKMLGLSWPFTDKDLKEAHRKYVFENHPDRGGDADKFKIGQAAYELLRTLTAQ